MYLTVVTSQESTASSSVRLWVPRNISWMSVVLRYLYLVLEEPSPVVKSVTPSLAPILSSVAQVSRPTICWRLEQELSSAWPACQVPKMLLRSLARSTCMPLTFTSISWA